MPELWQILRVDALSALRFLRGTQRIQQRMPELRVRRVRIRPKTATPTTSSTPEESAAYSSKLVAIALFSEHRRPRPITVPALNTHPTLENSVITFCDITTETRYNTFLTDEKLKGILIKPIFN
jgi:hypothetical protein